MKKTLFLVQLFLGAFLCQDALSLDENRTVQTKITVGIGNTPESFIDSKGKINGLFADYMMLIEKYSGLVFEQVQTPFTQATKAIKEKKIDMFLPLHPTKERDEIFNYSSTLIKFSPALIQKKGAKKINSISDIENQRIGVSANSGYQKMLEELEINATPYKTPRDGLIDVYLGKVDAYFGSALTSSMNIPDIDYSNMSVTFLEMRHPTNDNFIGVPKEEKELLRKLNAAIEQITPQEHYELRKKWLPLSIHAQEQKEHGFVLGSKQLEYLSRLKEIRMCVDPAFPPFGMISTHGEYVGITADKISLISKRVGVKVVLHPTKTWSESIAAVKEGKCDILADAMETPLRREFLNFTRPHTKIALLIYARDDVKDIVIEKDINGKRVGVVKGYAYIDYFKQTQPYAKYIEYDSVKEAIEALSTGKIDAFLNDAATTNYYKNELDIENIHIATISSFEWKLGIGVRKELTELHEILDSAVETLTPKDEAEILSKWITTNYVKRSDYGWTLKYLWLFIISFVALGAWIFTLKREVGKRIKAENRARDIFKKHNGVMLLIDPKDGKIIDCNAAAALFYGYSLQEMTHMNIKQINSLSPSEVQYEMERAASEKRNYFLFKHRLKNGEVRDVEVRSSPIERDNEKILFSIIHDITDKMRIEKERNELQSLLKIQNENLETLIAQRTKELEEQKEEYRFLLDNMPIMVHYKDTNNNIVKANEELCRFSGKTKTQIEGKNSKELFPDNYEQYYKEDMLIINSKKPLLNYVEKFDSEQGARYFESSKIPTFDNKGDVKGILVITREVTDLIKAEDELRKREQLLQQQSRFAAMGEMIGAIAHQWRQPLNALSGTFINIDDDFRLGRLTRETLDANLDKGERLLTFMSRTIDDFRNFFKPNTQKTNFNIIESVIKTLEIMSAQLKQHQINCSLTLNDALIFDYERLYEHRHISELEIFGHSTYFQQAILNLIANAKDAIMTKGTTKGEIEINITTDQKMIKIEVEDNGGGIPSDIIDKVFDPYFSTKGEKGTGIGLFMTKTIIQDSFCGDISAQNTQSGAKFTIMIRH